MSFGYSGETAEPRKDGPERFLHFEVLRQAEPLPPGVRRARLGGRAGVLARPSSRDYGSETYWANHARFFWREHGVKYAATLHDFGPDTVRVLGALIARLRPANRLRPAPRGGRTQGVRTIPVAVHGPLAVVAGVGGQVWVAGQGDNGEFAAPGESHRPSLVRIDPTDRRVAGKPVQIHFAAGPVAISNGESLLWVTHSAPDESRPLRLHDPRSGRLVRSFAGIPNAAAVAVGFGSGWVVGLGDRPKGLYHRGDVRRAQPTGGHFSATIPVGRAPAGIAVGSGSVWVSNELDDTVTRIDPRTNQAVATVPVGDGPLGIAATRRAIWIANGRESTISRIDAHTNRVLATIRVGRGPRGVTIGRGSVWVTNERDDTASRIDPATNKVIETIPVGAGPAGLAYTATEPSGWRTISTRRSPRSIRKRVLRTPERSGPTRG